MSESTPEPTLPSAETPDDLRQAAPGPNSPPDPRMRSRRLKLIAVVVGLVVGLVLAEAVARMVFVHGPGRSLEPLRAALAGELLPAAAFQRCIAQPYLLYAPAPGQRTKTGEIDHNLSGYRGRPVPLKRSPGTARVLCLGGSTTYCWRVETADQAYPARLQELLEARLPAGWSDVEVINAGIPFGTSAELLTHYHFKFHYFRPDVVIIHTGGNDALAVGRGYYHPDYSHWRRPLALPDPWAPAGRRLLQSRLASLILLPFVGGVPRGSQTLERPADTPPEITWFSDTDDASTASDTERFPAFRHNIESLLDLVAADGTPTLLVPFRLDPLHAVSAEESDQVRRHAEILESLGDRDGVAVAPFPDSTISPGNWLDDCHLTPNGCREKATYLEPFVRKLLERPAASGDQ
ncbi:MAG: GDSL-type esterase/lipase family protein [Planctomycetaceae bacterium]